MIINLETPVRTREGDTYYYYCVSNPLPYIFGSTDSANDILRVEIENLDTAEIITDNLYYDFNPITDNVTVDISGVLKSQIDAKQITVTDITVNQGVRENTQFNFRINAYENESLTPFFTEDAIGFHVAKQIGDEFGANLADKVGGDITETTTYQGEFLTEFESPYHFIGYDFEIDFINNGEGLIANTEFKDSQEFISVNTDLANLDKINLLKILDSDLPNTAIGEYKLKIQKNEL